MQFRCVHFFTYYNPRRRIPLPCVVAHVTWPMHRGLGWKHLSVRADARAANLVGHAYPIVVQRIILIRARSYVKIFYHIVFRWSRSNMHNAIVFWNNSTGRDAKSATDRLYSSPDILPKRWGGQIDETSFMDIVMTKLNERYQNNTQFRL